MNISPISVNNNSYLNKNQNQPNFKKLQIENTPEMKLHLLELKRKSPSKFAEYITSLSETLEDTKFFNGLLKLSKSKFGSDRLELVLTHAKDFVWPGKAEEPIVVSSDSFLKYSVFALHSHILDFYRGDYNMHINPSTANNSNDLEYTVRVYDRRRSYGFTAKDTLTNKASAIRDLDDTINLLAENSPCEVIGGYRLTYHPYATPEQVKADLAETEASKKAYQEAREAKVAEHIININKQNEPEIDALLAKYGV